MSLVPNPPRTDTDEMELNHAVRAAQPDSATMTILHSLFAVTFAAFALGVLSCFGFVVRSSTSCPACHGYSQCAILQDCRSVMSFVIGALLCCLMTKGREDLSIPAADLQAQATEKVQLYAYM